MSLLLKGAGALVTCDMEKAEVMKTFTSVFASKASFQESLSPVESLKQGGCALGRRRSSHTILEQTVHMLS